MTAAKFLPIKMRFTIDYPDSKTRMRGTMDVDRVEHSFDPNRNRIRLGLAIHGRNCKIKVGKFPNKARPKITGRA